MMQVWIMNQRDEFKQWWNETFHKKLYKAWNDIDKHNYGHCDELGCRCINGPVANVNSRSSKISHYICFTCYRTKNWLRQNDCVDDFIGSEQGE